MTFSTKFNKPIEIVVTGCLKAPLFQCGITDEEEFENELKTSLVPVAMVDNGCIVQISSRKAIMNSISRLNDASIYCRSAFTKSQNTAPDSYNSQFGRPWTPIRWWCDNFVPCGIACSFPGSNYNQYPPDWASGIAKWTNLVDSGSWGQHHEMNHHRQSNWGFNGCGEATNNIINGVVYSTQTRVASARKVNDNGEFICPNAHNAKVVGYCMLKNRNTETQWHILMQYFGIKNFQKYTKMCTDNKEFPSDKYSGYCKHVLSATKVFKTGLFYYFVLFNPNFTTLLGDKADAFYAEYNRSPYRNVQFHPVFCFYCVGFERNGAKFVTTSNYEVYPVSKTHRG